MRFPTSAATVWLCLTLLPAAVPAATLLSVSNGSLNGLGAFIRHTIGEPTVDNASIAVQWTQTVSVANAEIRAALVAAAVNAPAIWPIDAYITTEIGRFASVDDVVASTTFDLNTPGPIDYNDPPMTTLFTGLNLNPGTYYLVLATSADSGSLQNPITWWGDPNQDAVRTTAQGFSLGPAYRYADDPFFDFHPAAAFLQYDAGGGLFWDLSVPEQVPEPGTLSLFAAAAVLMAVRRPGRRTVR